MDYLKDLDEAYWTLTSKLTKQMANTVAERSVISATEAVSDGMLNALVGTFVVNIVFQGAMLYLVSFINSLQLLIHLPMFNIVMPGNVNSFLQILVPVV